MPTGRDGFDAGLLMRLLMNANERWWTLEAARGQIVAFAGRKGAFL